jgi:hypothetical protein
MTRVGSQRHKKNAVLRMEQTNKQTDNLKPNLFAIQLH